MAGGRLWTPEEERYLIENYTKLGRKACATHLKRPINGVKCHAYTLGIQTNVAWSEREEKLLVKMYPLIGRAGCAKLLPGRTIASVGVRAGFLRLTNDKRHTTTRDEVEVVRVVYPQPGGRKKCAQLLPHLTPSTISYLAKKLDVLQRDRKDWTDSENQLLRLNYANKGKHWCAQQLLDRTANAIFTQAKKLGLSSDREGEYFKDWQARAAASKVGRSRPGAREMMKKLWEQGRIPRPIITAERRQKQSDMMRDRHARYGNPNKGKTLSSEIKLKMSAASRRKWSDPEFGAKMRTPERRAKRRQTSSENWIRSGRANENAYSRCNGGRRDDLGGKFFRSGWEANYARILNFLQRKSEICKWEYEPKRFKFPMTNGPLSYTPDFRIWEREGRNCYYVEIKGWMDEKSQLKLQLMTEFYPDVPIRIIGQREYKNLQTDFASQIQGWEFYSSRYIAKRKVT